jgi:hypothetical protein
MAERYDGSTGKQYLYVAWDQFCPTQKVFKARLKVYDITAEASPILLWLSECLFMYRQPDSFFRNF